MPTTLDGPRRPPASGGKAKSLVIFLHGYGSDGHDLIELAGPLGAVLPDTAFAAPNAPAPCEMGGSGYQWFGRQNSQSGPGFRAEGADRAAVPLMEFIAAELDRNGLDASHLALVGFSQGSMMSLHVGLRRLPSPAAIVAFSGMLVSPETLAAQKLGAPPVLLIHGTADEMLPFERMEEAATALRGVGIEPETLTCPGLGHGIDQAGLEAAAGFLRRHL